MFVDKFSIKNRRDLTSYTDDEFSSGKRLRVCIVTEEIYGPIRNGGIANTYFHLASLLASEGHQVTVLYLRGNHSENGPIEKWVEFYKDRRIEFVCLAESRIQQASVREFRLWKYSAVYFWFRENDRFDVVHTSEWRGGAYFLLLARRFGGIFDNTLFIIKSSSPWIWNRHYMNELLFNKDQVIFMHGEKLCIEMGDIIIGGSAHLLSFMENAGYRINPDKVFVQPNIVDFSHLTITDTRTGLRAGDRIRVNEWVFFGRLEMRKGLHLFCDALDELAQKNKLPEKITFLGKQARGFPGYPGVMAGDYINTRSRKWDCLINIVCDKHQNEAIQYMVSNTVLAVMPSIIENSTMAVYEALIFHIPMLATSVGGTPELIVEEQRNELLCEPKARSLVEKLEISFDKGALIGRAPFSPEGNIDIWKRFHRWLANNFDKHTVSEINDKLLQKKGMDDQTRKVISLSLCLVLEKPDDTEQMLEVIKQYHNDLAQNDEIIIGITGPGRSSYLDGIVKVMEQENIKCRVFWADRSGVNPGECLNALCEQSKGDWLIINRIGRSRLDTGLFPFIRGQGSRNPFCVLTWSERNTISGKERINIPMAENSALFLTDPYILGGPDMAIKRDSWLENKFLEAPNIDHPELEMIIRASCSGLLCALPEIFSESVHIYPFPQPVPYYLRKAISEELPFGMKVLLSLRRLDPGYPEDGFIFGSIYLKLTRMVRFYRSCKYRLKGGDHNFRK